MAKVSGPLMSFDASGTVAGVATFSKWKGRNYVRNRVIPSNPQTPAQVAVRTSMAGLVALFKANAAAINIAFETPAKQKSVSPFNAFTGFNQKRLGQGLYAANSDAPTNAAPANNVTSLAATVAGKYVELTFTDAIAADAWEVLIYRKLGADPTGLNSELVGAVTRGVQKFNDGPLTSGTWHYVAAAVSSNGGRIAVSAAVTATIP